VPHDAGVALGAAMLKCAEAGHKIAPLTHAYWGPEYSNDEIRNTLDKIGARYEVLDDPVSRCVTDLVEQKTVGWFQGRMEYGPRALGNRSIIADPRSAGMKDRINVGIKYREEFRPFCPSVLYERQGEYFKDSFDAPFMVVTFPVIDNARDKIPAVVHVDGTARIQSVQTDTNPLYTRLIGEFAKASSVPMLINTSLNINEQPTVNAPLEALHTYFCSGLDALYLGPYRLSKPAAN
jgi:carbamoyltransferase